MPVHSKRCYQSKKIPWPLSSSRNAVRTPNVRCNANPYHLHIRLAFNISTVSPLPLFIIHHFRTSALIICRPPLPASSILPHLRSSHSLSYVRTCILSTFSCFLLCDVSSPPLYLFHITDRTAGSGSPRPFKSVPIGYSPAIALPTSHRDLNSHLPAPLW